MNIHAILAAMLVGAAPAVAGPTLLAQWTGAGVDVDVDGDIGEWAGTLVPAKDGRFELGARNDSDHIYVCVRVLHDRDQMQALRAGLSLWLDPDGDPPRTALRYPIVTGPGPSRQDTSEHGDEPDDRVTQLRSRVIAHPTEAEVLESDGDVRTRRPLHLLPGIEVAIGDDDGVLVYELKVPLRVTADTPYGIDATEGTISFELEAKKVDVEASGRGGRPQGDRMGQPGGGGPGRGGGGRRQGGGPGGRPEPPKQHPFSLEGKIELASRP